MRKNKLSYDELSRFSQSLAVTLHAGVGMGDSLALMAEDEKDTVRSAAWAEMGRKLDSGMTLSTAMREADLFPVYTVGLVEVGERTGKLEEALAALARYYEQRDQMDWRIRNALTYPAVLLLLMLVVIVVLLTKVMPVFEGVYASLGGQLTGLAGGLLKLGQGLSAIMPLLLVLLALVVMFVIVFALSGTVREGVLAFWRRRRGDRGIARRQSDARFAQALSMGLSSGLPLEEAMELAASLLEDNPAAAARCHDCMERLERGEELSLALEKSGVLPSNYRRLLTMGLRGGNGDTAMQDISRRLSEEADRVLESKVSRVEPALVLVATLLVGVILLAVMLPLVNIVSVIG